MAGLGGESVEDEPLLPKFDYYLDESDPEVVVLRRQDGTFVAAFSAQGVTREGILEAAREALSEFVASRAREGEKLELWVDPHKAQLFNPQNGAHLTL